MKTASRSRFSSPQCISTPDSKGKHVFGRHISLKTLALLSRSLSTMLSSGVPLLKSLEIASRNTGQIRCQEVMREITEQIRNGGDLSSGMREQRGYFPDLFIDMVDVAEQSGSLPEVLRGLADHYDHLVRLRRSFIGAITWPVIQLVAAISIVALLILVMGVIAEMQKGAATDMLGWGLIGPRGAIKWLCMTFGSIGSVIAGYFLVSKFFHQQRFLDGVLLRIPVVGTCMRSFAIARFSWAFALTQQAGMRILPSLGASFRATGNGAFMGAAPPVCDAVEAGEEISQALEGTWLFPENYLHMVRVAEATGTIPEMLERLSPDFEEQAQRSLKALATALGWVIWTIVAGLIVFIIFSIFLKYVGMINDLSK